jgi:diguanylate cyclase (GGDEF)-like protein
LSILVLQPSTAARDVLAATLRGRGFGCVRVAGSIAETLNELSESADVEIVIVDVGGEPAISACRRIRAANSSMPVLLLLDERSAGRLEAAFEAGATDCVSKPLQPIELCARLRAALRRSSESRPAGEAEAGIDRQSQHRPAPMIGEPSFSQSIDRAWRRHLRAHTPLSLIVADVDHLASYNERCGREAGEACLGRVATALREGIFRPDDVAVDRGAGEFAFILPGTDRTGAVTVAERLRETVAELAIPYPALAGGQYLTISLGVATAIPSAGLSAEDLVQAAERALSKAKLGGRKRVGIEEDCSIPWPA